MLTNVILVILDLSDSLSCVRAILTVSSLDHSTTKVARACFVAAHGAATAAARIQI